MEMENSKYLYSIGEVAEMLGESVSLVRFWSNEFSKFIKPKRNGKGNRFFSPEDVEVFKQIYHLVKIEGLTLQGASKRLREDSKAATDKIKVIESLKAIRSQLAEIRSALK